MLKKLLCWITRGDRPARPALLQEGDRKRAMPPPPPPPPARPGAEHPPAAERPKVPTPKRRLRLVKGEGQDVTDAHVTDTSAGPSEQIEEPTAENAPEEPKVKLVFSDGSSTRVATSDGTGVRIRYLAENILPPEGPSKGS